MKTQDGNYTVTIEDAVIEKLKEAEIESDKGTFDQILEANERKCRLS